MDIMRVPDRGHKKLSTQKALSRASVRFVHSGLLYDHAGELFGRGAATSVDIKDSILNEWKHSVKEYLQLLWGQ